MRKTIAAVTVLLAAALCLSSCAAAPEDRLTVSGRSEAQITYYVGDTFDSFVEGDQGAVRRVPEIYIQRPDGTRSEDLSHSENTVFSGYDLTHAGRQTVKVTYTTEEGKQLRTAYMINVVEETILFIEADDNLHYMSGSFRVGEPFSTYQVDEYGIESGVTVWLHFDSQVNPCVGYFTNEEKMREAVFDTAECKLDENGCFTEAGIFTVKVTFREFDANYSIRVTE